MSEKIMDTNSVDRNRYADWLKAAIDSNVSYHNHKETMAWTATAFYLTAMFGLAYWADRTIVTGCAKGLFTVFVVLAAYLVSRFLNMQFRMRWKADDIAVGLHRAMARVAAGSMTQSGPELEVDYGDCRTWPRNSWPRFIQREIRWAEAESKERRTWLPFVKGLYYEFFAMLDEMKNKFCAIFGKKKEKSAREEESARKVDDRLWTEVPSYFAVIAATAVAIALVWW